jgi:ArsR family transcriptional regulator, virulence genes transcriptional regulator
MAHVHSQDEVKLLSGEGKAFEQAATVLSVMSQPTRLVIMSLLVERELSITHLMNAIGGDDFSLFQHLAVLRSSGLIKIRRGRETYYSCQDKKVLSILKILEDEFGYLQAGTNKANRH